MKITQIRLIASAIHDGIINPFCDLNIEDTNKVTLYLNLIRAYGIPQIDLDRMAARCLKLIEAIETKKKHFSDTQNDDDWDSIPF